MPLHLRGSTFTCFRTMLNPSAFAWSSANHHLLPISIIFMFHKIVRPVVGPRSWLPLLGVSKSRPAKNPLDKKGWFTTSSNAHFDNIVDMMWVDWLFDIMVLMIGLMFWFHSAPGQGDLSGREAAHCWGRIAQNFQPFCEEKIAKLCDVDGPDEWRIYDRIL